jgi:hypothetical protein
MQEYAKSLAGLAATGALIGVAKMLVSSEELTFRVMLGRAILGAATSTVAGIVLLKFPDIPPLALLACGSGVGILGQQYIEKTLRGKLKGILRDVGEE